MILLIASCTRSERHEVLSFFFDGVPPLPGEVEAPGEEEGLSFDPRRRPLEPDWVVHEPQNNCVRCHGDQSQRNFSREVQLTAPVPHLCFECHRADTQSDGWIHGPVAAGQCVLCHEPHRSRHPALLKKAVPDLCMQCHQSLETVEHHTRENYAACLDCHWGHTSTAKHLLKAGPLTAPTWSGATEPTGDPEFDQSLAQARSALQTSRDWTDAWNSVAAYARQGQMKRARAYLLAIRMDPAFTEAVDQQWSALREALAATEQAQVRQTQQARQEAAREMAQLYYQSVNAYRDGDERSAREGFTALLDSDVVPDVIKQSIRGYLEQLQQPSGQGEASR